MKQMLLSFVAAVAVLLALSPRISAASSVYLSLKLDGVQVKGECTLKGRENTIECLSYEQLIDQNEAGAGASADHGDQKALATPITIRKYIDKTSPVLLQAMGKGEATADGIFQFYRPNPSGTGTSEFYTVEGKVGLITSIRQFVPNALDPATANEPPQEDVVFSFLAVRYTVTDGGVTASIAGGKATSLVGPSSGVGTITPPLKPVADVVTATDPDVIASTYPIDDDQTALDLTGDITPLPAPDAGPNDATGATLVETVPGQMMEPMSSVPTT